MDSNERDHEHTTCPNCGHSNVPGAAFCAQCGQQLDGDAPADAESTSVYRPIGGTESEASSPWAPPQGDDTIIDVDPGQTTTFPVGGQFSFDDASGAGSASRTYPQDQGIRGLILGIIAVILIAAVIGLYVYSAWLSISVRDTIDGWLPWVS